MTTAVGEAAAQQGWVPDLGSFGVRLALVRQHKGWNIAEAERSCGVGRGSWALWESGGREPSRYITICMQIAGAAGVDLDWLVYGPVKPGGQPSARYPRNLPDLIDPPMPAALRPRVVVRHGDSRRRNQNDPSGPNRPPTVHKGRPISLHA